MAKKPEDIGRIPSRVSKEAKKRLDELASVSGRTQTSIIEEGIKMVAKLRKPTAKAIVIASDKGGIGKTTAAGCLGHSLTKLGNKVLLIDFDHQGSLSELLQYDPEYNYQARVTGSSLPHHITLTDAVFEYTKDEPGSIEDYILTTGVDNLDIIAGDDGLINACKEIRSYKNDYGINILKRIIQAVKDLDKYDFIIIDTHPDLNEDTSSVFLAADCVLVPTTLDKSSIKAIIRMIRFVKKIQIASPDLTLLGVFFNIVERGTQSTDLAYEGVTDTLPADMIFNTQISRGQVARQSELRSELLTVRRPKDKISLEYMALAKEVVTRLG